MARATWSGSISFGLVHVPVKLFTAVRSHDVQFRQLHAETRARVRYQRIDEQTGEPVASSDIVKGYEVGDGEYVLVDPDELRDLDPEASRTIEIHDFVDLPGIDPIHYDRPYFLAPDGEAAVKPYRLLTMAMERARRVAIASFVMRTKEHLAAIRAHDGILVLSTMHHADEVIDPAELADEGIGAEVELRDQEVAMAEQLIDSLTTDFEPTAYRDEYQRRLVAFLEAKAEGQELHVTPPERDTGGVVDLMAALEASLRRAQDAGEPGVAGDPYAGHTRDELYAQAQARDLPGRSSMSKDELLAALRADDDQAGAA